MVPSRMSPARAEGTKPRPKEKSLYMSRIPPMPPATAGVANGMTDRPTINTKPRTDFMLISLKNGISQCKSSLKIKSGKLVE